LHRPGTETLPLDRRGSRRWERLSEVLHELDDLRDRGERLLSGSGRPGPRPGDAVASDVAPADGGEAERP
ncbi:MAG: hypothetical protein ACRDY1_01210, partial [Acidimicrobiales bacterium]